MFANLTGWHAIILLVVVLLLFGATRLPALARSVGQSARIFKQETRSHDSTRNAAAEQEAVPVDAVSAPAGSAQHVSADRTP